MRDCISCYNYNKPSCPFKDLDKVNKLKSRIYLNDCWCYCTEEDAIMCECMCGEVEDEV